MIQNDSSSASTTSSLTPADLSSALSEDGFIDEGLAQAAISAVQMGSLTPLLKEELRCSIQTKRLSEGKEELTVEYVEPKNERLTPAEEERRRRRRERNKMAAQKCRGKKRDMAEALDKESVRLEAINQKLKEEVKKLEEEKAQLRNLLRRHDTSTQCAYPQAVNLGED